MTIHKDTKALHIFYSEFTNQVQTYIQIIYKFLTVVENKVRIKEGLQLCYKRHGDTNPNMSLTQTGQNILTIKSDRLSTLSASVQPRGLQKLGTRLHHIPTFHIAADKFDAAEPEVYISTFHVAVDKFDAAEAEVYICMV